MICLDMLHTNARGRASVLENLAWLHFDARNYSFSSELFLAREPSYLFTSEKSQNFTGQLQRSSYFSGLKDEAVAQMQKALDLLPKNSKYQAIFRERLSFYKMNAKVYTRELLKAMIASTL